MLTFTCAAILVLIAPTLALAAPPTASISSPGVSTSVSASTVFKVTWSGGTGSVNYDVQYKDGSSSGAWTTWKYKTTSKSASFTGTAGHTYHFRVRARNSLAQAGLWTKPAATVVPKDDPSASYSSSWTKVSDTACYKKTVRYAKTSGKYLKFTFTGREFKLVGMKKTTTGKFSVYLDGSSKAAATVDTKASSTKRRQTLWSKTWTKSGTHTVKVKVLGTSGRPRVYVDAFAAKAADTTKPTLTGLSSGAARADQAAIVNVSASDNVYVSSARLYYRITGAAAYSSVAMTRLTDTGWRASIPAATLANAKVQYYVAATDSSGNVGTSAAYTLTPCNRITIVPASATVTGGSYQNFSARAWTKSNASMAITPTWSVKGGIGTISAAGQFRATTGGAGSVAASWKGLWASSAVTVLAERSGELTVNETWTEAGGPYIVGDLEIPTGISLRIEPGTVVKFKSAGGLTVGGTLDIAGSAEEPVVLTSIKDDTHAGDTNGDGKISIPAAGNWDGIYADEAGTASIDYAEIGYGGSSWSGWSSYGYSSGVVTGVDNSTLTLKNTVLQTNRFGVCAFGCTGLQIQGNTFTDNTEGGVWVDSPPYGMKLSGNSFGPGKYAGVRLEGEIKDDLVLPNEGVYSTSSLTVPSGSSLTVSPGTIIKFVTTTGINVDGTMIANGTAVAPIKFTSVKDDSVGGDTNGDGSISLPAPGNWSAIVAGNAGTLLMDYCSVSYGAYGWTNGYSYAAVQANSGSTLSLKNSTVTKNTYGFQAGGASTLTLTGNSFANNTSGAAGVTNPPEGATLSGNTFSGKNNGIRLEGTISGDLALPAQGVYQFGSITVPGSAVLSIGPGSLVKFVAADSWLWVDGTLAVNGSGPSKVVFTSMKDDSVGGDTNGDGAITVPTPGGWDYIYMSNGGIMNANYAVFKYGARSFTSGPDGINNGAVQVGYLGTLNATNCDFMYNKGAITANTVWEGEPFSAHATNCYWNSASGPTYSGHVAGDPVSWHKEDRDYDGNYEVYVDVEYLPIRTTPLP